MAKHFLLESKLDLCFPLICLCNPHQRESFNIHRTYPQLQILEENHHQPKRSSVISDSGARIGLIRGSLGRWAGRRAAPSFPIKEKIYGATSILATFSGLATIFMFIRIAIKTRRPFFQCAATQLCIPDGIRPATVIVATIEL